MKNVKSAPIDITDVPELKQIGIVLSYTLVYEREKAEEAFKAHHYMADFQAEVAKLAEKFPRLMHTVASRQEYHPGEK